MASAEAAGCPETQLVQPFVSWGDSGSYSLVPGGTFEAGSPSWSYTGGAKVLAGGEPYAVLGSVSKNSAVIPAGASAQSPFECVEPTDRDFRFFLGGGGSAATVTVRAVYQTPLGAVAIPLKSVSTTGGWELSPTIHTGAALLAALIGSDVNLALRFTSTSGTARIDEVYLDPRMKR